MTVSHADNPVVLAGGTVFDSESGGLSVRDVRIADGIVSDAPVQPGDTVIDATGLVVSPGLVDFHTHIFAGQDVGVSADEIAFPAGTTTMIDAGSAGAHLIGAFRASTLERSTVQIRAFVNIATIGTTSILLGGELLSPWYVSEDAAVEAIEANRDFVIGVKVRASANVGGEHTRAALASARRVADKTGLPLMVHLGPAPASIDEIADTLEAGDIITHAFSGWDNNTVLGEDRRIRSRVLAARQRGVLLDIGHGMSAFSLDVAKGMLEDGQPPDIISTDIHAYSLQAVVDLPTVMSKFLALGMSLSDVLERVTRRPAQAAGLDVGHLRSGSVANLVVLRIREESLVFPDTFGGSVEAEHRLETVMTFSGGHLKYDGRSR